MQNRNISASLFSLLFLLSSLCSNAQNRVTYAGGSGNETFYDVIQLSDGTFLVAGSASSLSWVVPSVSTTVLSAGSIKNASGTNVYGFIMQLNSNLSSVLRLVHFPQGAVEDIKFMKTTSKLGEPTGSLFISGTTKDTKANAGGYFVAKLNNNFVNGAPTDIAWARPIWAETDIQLAQPWDVGSDGKVVYVTGQYNAADWSALQRMNASGVDEVIENFTTHWKVGGGEYYGTASSNPTGGAAGLAYSAVVLKVGNRCSLRSWTAADFNAVTPDENGGTKKGRMPLDVFYDSPCVPNVGPTTGGGYTGYTINTQTLGATSVTIDRRDNRFYLGMNIKSKLPNGLPDFEPTVIAFNVDGGIRWWSRLYHETTPAGANVNSSPDQYVDALAIDYAADNLVVAARSHGNNVENLWEGNTIASNPTASAFQNQFTGTNGNIHLQWLGKMRLTDGQLQRSTYFGEYNEGSNNYGTPHPDPNMDGFPNPNAGWANMNTTRMPKNTLKTTADGSVCVIAVGRRTMTTANAFQKMPLPSTGLTGTWNNFVRVYKPDFSVPLYSSMLVGQWNTATGAGGDNITLNGVWKTQTGVVVVGRATSGGSAMPTANVPAWGSATENGTESAVLGYFSAANLYNAGDGIAVTIPVELVKFSGNSVGCGVETRHALSLPSNALSLPSNALSLPSNALSLPSNALSLSCHHVLNWETASEIGTESFDIQQSAGDNVFKTIGTIKAMGKAGTYTFKNDAPLRSTNYYRLKINDTDGKTAFSPVISLENGFILRGPRVYPNPASDVLFIENADNQEITIVNVLGQVVMSVPKAINHSQLIINQLKSGVYFVKMGNETVRFVKN
jgi:Secretion system C-terminal sorting domain